MKTFFGSWPKNGTSLLDFLTPAYFLKVERTYVYETQYITLTLMLSSRIKKNDMYVLFVLIQSRFHYRKLQQF